MDKFIKFIIYLLIILMSLILFYENVKAESGGDWKLSTNLYKTIASDTERIVQSGRGFQINLQRGSLYIYGSKDINPVRFGGQHGIDIDIYSLGFGFQNRIDEKFTFFFDIGWYEPKHDTSNQDLWETTLSEGLYIYLNENLAASGTAYAWDYYTLEYHGAIGGKIGISYSQPLYKNISLDVMIRYRFLHMEEMVKGKNYEPPYGWWEYKKDRDFGGWMIGGAFTIEF